MLAKRIKRFIMLAASRIAGRRISVYAAQATFFIIISALPFMMLIVSVLKYIIPQTQGDLIMMSTRFLPTAVVPFLNSLLDEIYKSATIPIASVTTFTALWAASRGIMALCVGLDNIYCTHSAQRSYLRIRAVSVLYTVVFMVMLFVMVLSFIGGKYAIRMSESKMPMLYGVFNFLANFPAIASFLILTLVFALLYKLLPGQKIAFADHIPGAAFAAGGWTVFSAVYSFYVDSYTNYSYIYGSLTAIVLLMLWLYFCMNIFLWGAEINEYLHEKKMIKQSGRA